MKPVNFILAFAVLMFLGTAILFAQNKQDKKEQKQRAVKELVLSQKYKVEVSQAIPTTGKTVFLTSPYSLEVRNDSVVSYLPYYGRAYSIPYGGGDGLNFKAPFTGYKIEWDKKGTAKVRFSVRNSEDKYDFSIDVFANGSSSIYVNMQNRQSIRFQGELDLKK